MSKRPDFSLLIDSQMVKFDFDTSKKEEIAEILIEFFQENKGIATYFQACLAASVEKGFFE